MAGYCLTTDLLHGDIPLPSYIDKQVWVDKGAEEIDSKIGFRYSTPVPLTGNTVDRPAVLLLKNLNAFITTGRILMAVDASGEDTQVHAYAQKLLSEAYSTLDAIADGRIDLTGAELNTNAATKTSAIIVNNIDSESQVEAFYDRIANPNYSYGYTEGTVINEGFVR
ncbi:MAG TPA: hypothetical protein VIY48_18015 [Candidatus Paceibacterota bacterium]